MFNNLLFLFKFSCAYIFLDTNIFRFERSLYSLKETWIYLNVMHNGCFIEFYLKWIKNKNDFQKRKKNLRIEITLFINKFIQFQSSINWFEMIVFFEKLGKKYFSKYICDASANFDNNYFYRSAEFCP